MGRRPRRCSTGAALFSGFYLNELLMKLLARHDPHAALFDAYAATLARPGQRPTSARDAGGAARLRARAAEGDRPPARSRHRDGDAAAGRAPSGATACSPMPASSRPTPATRRRSSGATLLALEAALRAATSARCSASPRGALAELRPLLRAQLHYHLGTSQLRTRQVMLEAQALVNRAMNPLVTTGQTAPRRARGALGQRQQDRAAAQHSATLGDPERRRRCRAIALEAGAHGITVHPRPDERHIRAGDVAELPRC